MTAMVKKKKKKRPRREIAVASLVSLIAHLLLLPFIPSLLLSSSRPEDEPTDEVTYILEDSFKDAQIVDLNDSASADTPPEDSRFLSDRNRRADRQTQARATGPQVPQRVQTQNRQKPTDKQQSSEDVAVNTREKAFKLNTELPPEWLASLTPAAPSNYLPGIEYGERTLLDTREYAYAHFFIRMKRQMELVWNPRRILQGTTNATRPEYRTIVRIVLNRDGTVHSVRMIAGSSISGLDNEAISAVYKAGPYLNPPKELVDPSGKIVIKDWQFIINQRRALF